MHAHVQAAQEAPLLPGFHDDYDRHMPRSIERADLRAQAQAIRVLQIEADNQEIVIAFGHLQQRPRRIGLTLDMLLAIQRLDQAVGRALTILHQEDSSVASGLFELRIHRRGEAHLLLGRSAHQHLVGQELEPRQVLHARDERDVIDQLREKIVRARLQTAEDISGLIERRHHDDGNMLRAWLRLQLAAYFEPVHARHHHVEQGPHRPPRVRKSAGPRVRYER